MSFLPREVFLSINIAHCFYAINADSPLVDVAFNDANKNAKKCMLSASALRVNDSWSF